MSTISLRVQTESFKRRGPRATIGQTATAATRHGADDGKPRMRADIETTDGCAAADGQGYEPVVLMPPPVTCGR